MEIGTYWRREHGLFKDTCCTGPSNAYWIQANCQRVRVQENPSQSPHASHILFLNSKRVAFDSKAIWYFPKQRVLRELREAECPECLSAHQRVKHRGWSFESHRHEQYKWGKHWNATEYQEISFIRLDEFVCDANVWIETIYTCHTFFENEFSFICVRIYFTVCYRWWYPFTLSDETRTIKALNRLYRFYLYNISCTVQFLSWKLQILQLEKISFES